MENLFNGRAFTVLKELLSQTKCARNSHKQEDGPSTSNDECRQEKGEDNECPLDIQKLGTVTWSLLHTIAAYYPDNPTETQRVEMKAFLRILAEHYPCSICGRDFRNDLKEMPPDTSSSGKLSHWLCQLHNRVNVKLGKPVFDCNRVFERWRDGWNDGSCE